MFGKGVGQLAGKWKGGCQQGAWREVGEMDQMERDEWEELNDSMLALLGGMPSLILR